MNTYRTMFRVWAAIAMMTYANNIMAVIGLAQNHGYGVILGSMAADKFIDKNKHAKKAFVSSIGLVIDEGLIKYSISNDEKDRNRILKLALCRGMFHFALNYSIRRGSQMVHDNVVTFEQVAKECDVLPKSIGNYINPTVRMFAEKITHPETLTILFFCMIKSMTTSK
ncbi:MAG TPA: hypothetical protein VLB80_00565 [Candidatus Babeliales bacterium]|nr:hypothetical protein [Candidatus Babeliales bacterium]